MKKIREDKYVGIKKKKTTKSCAHIHPHMYVRIRK